MLPCCHLPQHSKHVLGTLTLPVKLQPAYSVCLLVASLVGGCEAGQGCRRNTSLHARTLCSRACRPHSAQRAVHYARLTVLGNKCQQSVKVACSSLEACWRQREGHSALAAAQAELTARTAEMWRSGSLAAPRGLEPGWPPVPDRPARDDSKARAWSLTLLALDAAQGLEPGWPAVPDRPARDGPLSGTLGH